MPPSSSAASSSAPKKPSSSSVIAALQRASFGFATLPSTSSATGRPLTDADIADLIAREAREKEKVWQEFGLGAYRTTCVLPSSSAEPGCCSLELARSRRSSSPTELTPVFPSSPPQLARRPSADRPQAQHQ